MITSTNNINTINMIYEYINDLPVIITQLQCNIMTATNSSENIIAMERVFMGQFLLNMFTFCGRNYMVTRYGDQTVTFHDNSIPRPGFLRYQVIIGHDNEYA